LQIKNPPNKATIGCKESIIVELATVVKD
jgi:hypothetical protein